MHPRFKTGTGTYENRLEEQSAKYTTLWLYLEDGAEAQKHENRATLIQEITRKNPFRNQIRVNVTDC